MIDMVITTNTVSRAYSAACPGRVRIAVQGSRIARNGTELKLPPQILRLMVALISREKHLVSKDLLVDLLWGDDPEGGPETVRDIVDQYLFAAVTVAVALGFRLEAVHGQGVIITDLREHLRPSFRTAGPSPAPELRGCAA